MPLICGASSRPASARGRGQAAVGSGGSSRQGEGEGEGAATVELMACVAEFLQFHGFSATLEAFASERQTAKGRRPERGAPSLGAERAKAPTMLLERFDNGRREEFFGLWERHIPAGLLASDVDTAKLEFYLQIYFAIHPALTASGDLPHARAPVHASPAKVREELALRMGGFKAYLETRGAELARTGEFLPYYALPYVASPAEHPSFKDLFGGAWARELRLQLDLFLQTIPTEVTRPRLYAMEAASRSQLASMMSGAHLTGDRPVSALLRGEQQMGDLLGDRPVVASPPPGSPAAAPLSTSRSPALPATQSASTPSPPRPSLSQPQPKSNMTPPLRTSSGVGLGASLRDLPGVLRASVSLEGCEGPGQRSAFLQAILPPLDYHRIKRDLRDGDNATVAALLQALRWRISKSPAGNDRLRVVLTFVEQDVLLCRPPPGTTSAVVSIADRCSGPAAEELARLLNAMASTAAGRGYLLQPGAGTVSTLVQLLTAIPEMDTLNAPMILAHEGAGDISADSLLQQHALGALQKLSLRRSAQSEMIARGVIGTIVELLQARELSGGLSEYTVEYSLALLMNLSLRSAGRRRFEECDVLGVLDSLIESSNPQVRTYVNGTLYSVLQRSAIRNAARERGLGEFLQMVAANSEPVFARQIRYIQVQLNSVASDADGPPSGDEEEFEDVDEEGEELYGDENEEDFEPEEMLGKGGLAGEEFLCEGYLADASSARAEEQLMRESMAVAAAHANMAKHMQQGGGGLGGSLRAGAVAASMGGEMLQRPTTPASFGASLLSSNPGGGSHLRPTAGESSLAPASAPAPRPMPTSSHNMPSVPPVRPSSSEPLAPLRRAGSSAGSRGNSGGGASSAQRQRGSSPAEQERLRAEREAAALKAKIAAEKQRRDDPAGLLAPAIPSADEYLQAFGNKASIPRTPHTHSGGGR